MEKVYEMKILTQPSNTFFYLYCYLYCICSQSLLKRFIKAEILNDITALQMVKLDTTAKEARAGLKAVDIGLGAEVVLKVKAKVSNIKQWLRYRKSKLLVSLTGPPPLFLLGTPE